MKYLVAYDYSYEDPNPHEWEADTFVHDTYAEATGYAEQQDESMRKDWAPDEPELFPWIVVAVKRGLT